MKLQQRVVMKVIENCNKNAFSRLVEPKCKFAFCDYTPIKDFVNAEIIGNIYENPELLKEVKNE